MHSSTQSPAHSVLRRPRPEIRAVSFSTATIRSGGVAVAKVECAGIDPEDLRCEPVKPGFTVEVLPTRVREGRRVLMGIRVRRKGADAGTLCLLRVSAGSASALASITVLG